uniref:Uncharacterized protein n=1 Tax=Leersia perrieri TaxID=77586 RepID=A0A0D9WVR7_9ORYZ
MAMATGTPRIKKKENRNHSNFLQLFFVSSLSLLYRYPFSLPFRFDCVKKGRKQRGRVRTGDQHGDEMPSASNHFFLLFSLLRGQIREDAAEPGPPPPPQRWLPAVAAAAAEPCTPSMALSVCIMEEERRSAERENRQGRWWVPQV